MKILIPVIHLIREEKSVFRSIREHWKSQDANSEINASNSLLRAFLRMFAANNLEILLAASERYVNRISAVTFEYKRLLQFRK